jgi:hypothetical protein
VLDTVTPGNVVARVGSTTLPPGRVEGGNGRMGIVVGSVKGGRVELDSSRESVNKCSYISSSHYGVDRVAEIELTSTDNSD